MGNELIRDNRHFWKALFSDTWAYQGDRATPWVSYWRPVNVLWWMLNYRLFGFDSAFGWHATSLLLHIAVCLVSYGLLRCLGLARPVAAAIMFLFAVHPAHVESVTWISGSVDLLAAFGATSALWCELAAGRRGGRGLRIAATTLFAFGLLAKEACIVFPAIVFIALQSVATPVSPATTNSSAIRRAAPYAVLSVVYLAARFYVLGHITPSTPWGRGFLSAVATIPSMLAFYIRQALLPVWIGPSYPLRPVALDHIGWVNCFAPLIGVVAAGFLLLRLCRGQPARQLGLAIFVLFLLPTMNANAFIPEQLVHDRYLYLPLLGMLMVVVPALAGWLNGVFIGRERKARIAFFAIVAAAGVPLVVQTVRYNRVWVSEMALWEGSVRSDPLSAFNYTRYGAVLRQAGALREAGIAADRAIEIDPRMTYPYLLRADIAIAQQRYADAEKDLRLVFGHGSATIPLSLNRWRFVSSVRTGRRRRLNCFTRPGRRCLTTGSGSPTSWARSCAKPVGKKRPWPSSNPFAPRRSRNTARPRGWRFFTWGCCTRNWAARAMPRRRCRNTWP